MDNYWLNRRRYSAPDIKQISWPDTVIGNRWYVVKHSMDGDSDKSLYLHEDGTWFSSPIRDGEYTGYFDSFLEAEATLITSLS